MYDDVRWAVRRLARRVGFSTAFVAILGTTLGISLTVATVAHATLGAALPYADEEALYTLSEANAGQDIDGMESSLSAFRDWLDRQSAFEAIGAVRTRLNLTMDAAGGVTRIAGAVVSRSMFETLGVQPALGRVFSPEEDAEAASIPSILLSHGLWVDRFGSDPEIVGHSLVVNRSTWTVVGVLPEGQTLAPQYSGPVDVWLPLGMAGAMDGPAAYSNRRYRIYSLIGRMLPRADEAALDRDLSALTSGLAADFPESHQGWEWHAQPLRERVLSGLSTPIRALFVGGLLLFAVAVVNLLALYIQRLRAEHAEMATRLAVGARPTDLVRLSLVELALLGTVAGGLGVVVSAVAVPLLPYWLPIELPAHVHISFRWPLALVGIGAAAGSLLIVGLAGLGVALKGLERSTAAGGRIVGPSTGAGRMSRVSLASQIAMSTFLAIGSAIAVRSFAQLSRTGPGVDPARLAVLRVDVPPELRDAQGVETAADEILRRIRGLPGVGEAFLWSPHVPTEALWYTRVRLFDRPDVPDSESPTVRMNTVSAGAVTGLGLDVIAGRDLSEEDRETGRRVVLVSASAARAWWGSEEAGVGRMIRRWNHEDWSEVVGVVADAPLSGRQGEGSDFFNDVYFLFGQDSQRYLVFLARAQPGVTLRADDLRAAVQAAAPDLPPYDIRPMEARLAQQDALARSSAVLSSLFAATAVLLTALGLYGALSFVMNRKRREIGLRQALGATPGRVVTELVRGGAGVVLLGTGAGVALAWFGLDSVDAALFVVGSKDVPSYLTATSLLLAVSFAALLIPSLRVLRMNPGQSLREDWD